MNKSKKTFCIVLCTFIMAVGFFAFIFFALVTNMTIGGKIAGMLGCLTAMCFGWWLLRKGSKNARDALRRLADIFLPF